MRKKGPRDGDKRKGPRRDGDRPRGERKDGARREGGDAKTDRPRRQFFDAPPELPQRPKAKRIRPLRVNVDAVLAELPEAHRTIAEKVLNGDLREEQALRIGRQILRDNALELFPQLKERLWKKTDNLIVPLFLHVRARKSGAWPATTD